MKGDSYPTLTDEQKVVFRDACIGGVDPKEQCPLCLGRRLTKEMFTRYCEEHKSFLEPPTSLRVDCHSCKVRYGVILNRADEHTGCTRDSGRRDGEA